MVKLHADRAVCGLARKVLAGAGEGVGAAGTLANELNNAAAAEHPTAALVVHTLLSFTMDLSAHGTQKSTWIWDRPLEEAGRALL